MWHDGGHRCELDAHVAVRTDTVVQPYHAVRRALGHAVVTGYYDVDVTPEAGLLQLWNHQANVVVHLIAHREPQPSTTAATEPISFPIHMLYLQGKHEGYHLTGQT